MHYKKIESHSLNLQSDMDGSVRLCGHQIDEWFENDHMLSSPDHAQRTEKTLPPKLCSAVSPSNLTAAAEPPPQPAHSTTLLFASK